MIQMIQLQHYRYEFHSMNFTVCAGRKLEDDSGDAELLRGEEHHC